MPKPPPQGTVEIQTDRDLPWVMNFRSFAFEGKEFFRGRNAGQNPKWDIWTPPPKQINGNDNISYSQEEGTYDIIPTVLGLNEWVNSAFGIGTSLRDIFQISSTHGERTMDERQAQYGGASLRQHRYDWEFVPTSIEESKSIEEAAKAFQVSAYPLFGQTSNASIRVTHPDIWIISSAQLSGGGGPEENWRWDMSPLPSVIQSVNITSHGSAGGSYAMGNRGDNHPVKWNVGITFVELEPAIAAGNVLINRSALRAKPAP